MVYGEFPNANSDLKELTEKLLTLRKDTSHRPLGQSIPNQLSNMTAMARNLGIDTTHINDKKVLMQAAIEQRLLRQDIEAEGSMALGPHKGALWEDVLKDNKNYCGWACTWVKRGTDPHQHLVKFEQWVTETCKARGIELDHVDRYNTNVKPVPIHPKAPPVPIARCRTAPSQETLKAIIHEQGQEITMLQKEVKEQQKTIAGHMEVIDRLTEEKWEWIAEATARAQGNDQHVLNAIAQAQVIRSLRGPACRWVPETCLTYEHPSTSPTFVPLDFNRSLSM